MNLLDLYCKASNEKFNNEEIEFIKKNVPKNSFSTKYALYKKKSYKNAYIAFIIDREPNARRRSGVENHYEFICSRPLSEMEYEDEINNYGTNNRRFTMWYYSGIEALIDSDKQMGAETPKEFIERCKREGYTSSFQTQFKFS